MRKLLEEAYMRVRQGEPLAAEPAQMVGGEAPSAEPREFGLGETDNDNKKDALRYITTLHGNIQELLQRNRIMHGNPSAANKLQQTWEIATWIRSKPDLMDLYDRISNTSIADAEKYSQEDIAFFRVAKYYLTHSNHVDENSSNKLDALKDLQASYTSDLMHVLDVNNRIERARGTRSRYQQRLASMEDLNLCNWIEERPHLVNLYHKMATDDEGKYNQLEQDFYRIAWKYIPDAEVPPGQGHPLAEGKANKLAALNDLQKQNNNLHKLGTEYVRLYNGHKEIASFSREEGRTYYEIKNARAKYKRYVDKLEMLSRNKELNVYVTNIANRRSHGGVLTNDEKNLLAAWCDTPYSELEDPIEQNYYIGPNQIAHEEV